MGFRTLDVNGAVKSVGAQGPAGPTGPTGSAPGTGTAAARPSPSSAGLLYLPSDGFSIARDTGAAWVPWGPLLPLAGASDTGFAWLNQGSSTLTITGDALVLVGAAAANTANLVGRVKTAPATPWVLTAYLLPSPLWKNNHAYGLMVRQNGAGTGTGRIRGLIVAQLAASTTLPGQGVGIWGRTGATSAWADFAGAAQPVIEAVRWLRIADDGTNLKYSISADGQTWILLFSEVRTTYLLQGGDQIGFFVDTQNTATPNLDNALTVLSWKQA